MENQSNSVNESDESNQSSTHASKCQKIKFMMIHLKFCKRKNEGSCPICKQFSALNDSHAKDCTDDKCLFRYNPEQNEAESDVEMSSHTNLTKPSRMLQQVKYMLGSCNDNWRNSVTADYREHLSRLFSQAIVPKYALAEGKQFEALLLPYARIVEADVFKAAASKSDYCMLMTDKIFNIQKELLAQNQTKKLRKSHSRQRTLITSTKMRQNKKRVIARRRSKPIRKQFRVTPRQIVAHRKNCKQVDCAACAPLNDTLKELNVLKEQLKLISDLEIAT